MLPRASLHLLAGITTHLMHERFKMVSAAWSQFRQRLRPEHFFSRYLPVPAYARAMPILRWHTIAMPKGEIIRTAAKWPHRISRSRTLDMYACNMSRRPCFIGRSKTVLCHYCLYILIYKYTMRLILTRDAKSRALIDTSFELYKFSPHFWDTISYDGCIHTSSQILAYHIMSHHNNVFKFYLSSQTNAPKTLIFSTLMLSVLSLMSFCHWWLMLTWWLIIAMKT
jgi:hypothetical protein